MIIPEDPKLDPPNEKEPVACPGCDGLGCEYCDFEGDMTAEEFERRMKEDEANRRVDERRGK